MSNPIEAHLTPEEFGILAVCSCRYAIGRLTYIPREVCQVLKANLGALTANDRAVILRDITEAKSLGDPCDALEWEQLRRALARAAAEEQR